MIRVWLIACVTAVILVNCGSPEKYKKQGGETDGGELDMAIGVDVGKEHAGWARQLFARISESRLLYEAGDSLRAVQLADSLIQTCEAQFDSLPFTDRRSKFLAILLTDLHSQVITWQELRGDTADVQIRMRRFEDLAGRVRHTRDSLDNLP